MATEAPRSTRVDLLLLISLMYSSTTACLLTTLFLCLISCSLRKGKHGHLRERSSNLLANIVVFDRRRQSNAEPVSAHVCSLMARPYVVWMMSTLLICICMELLFLWWGCYPVVFDRRRRSNAEPVSSRVCPLMARTSCGC